jgi:hypothetical protein
MIDKSLISDKDNNKLIELIQKNVVDFPEVFKE